jgi:hypothetical protein
MRKVPVPMCLRACALIQKTFMLVVIEDFLEFFYSVHNFYSIEYCIRYRHSFV